MQAEQGVGEPTDKRGAVKWHNRRSIVEAAGKLAATQGVEGFTVSDLATMAGVSRRTIFNHFPSAQDAVYEYLSATVEEAIGHVLADLSPPRQTQELSLGEVYRELTQAMRPHNLRPVSDVLGPIFAHHSHAEDSPAVAMWGFRLTRGATDRMRQALHDRLPHRGSFELQLVAFTIINSVAVCLDEWLLRTEGGRTAQSARVWDDLLTETFEILGRGFET